MLTATVIHINMTVTEGLAQFQSACAKQVKEMEAMKEV